MKKIKVITFLLCCIFSLTACVPQINTSNDKNKLQLIFTIDTEDKVGNVPNMFECDFGTEGSCGVDYIMDTFEKYNMKAVFYVNVYEHLRYSGEYENYIENLVKTISERGHEVALHTHADATLGFYDKALYEYSYDEQKKIIQYGKNFIEEHTGKVPVSFRGGAYKVNEDTFRVLEEEGFVFESSYFYGNEGNDQISNYSTLNTVSKVGNLIEFPVIRVIKSNGKLTKLDLNTLNDEEIIQVLEQMKAREEYGAAQIMFHSFSFMDQKYDELDTLYFTEGTHKAYGVDEELQQNFENILSYISSDKEIEVVTFEQLSKHGVTIPPESADGIFVCDSDEAKKAAEKFVFVKNREDIVNYFDITEIMNGNQITFKNNYKNNDAQYAWYIYYNDDTENPVKFMYSAENTLTYTFMDDGKYQVKSFILIDGDKQSKTVTTILVKNGLIDCILN